jgi:hypothetical protein
MQVVKLVIPLLIKLMARAKHDEDLVHQMQRRAIIDAKDDEEEWVRKLE